LTPETLRGRFVAFLRSGVIVEDAQDDLTAGLVPVVETSIDTPDDTVRVRDPEERVSSVVRSEREDLRTPLRVRALVDDVEDAGRVLVLLG
jgi:hypothetical protein